MPEIIERTVDELAPLVKHQRDNRPVYLKAKDRSENGIVAMCPFGCREGAELDAHGYCDHLIGCSLGCEDGEVPEFFEPIVYKVVNGRETKDRVTDGSRLCVIEDDHFLVRVTTCYRVYTRTPNRKLIAAEDKMSKAEEMDSLRRRVQELEALIEN